MNWRTIKKHESRMFPQDYLAYCAGQAAAYYRQERRNPYPPGKRHKAFEEGKAQVDLMGDYHGRNA